MTGQCIAIVGTACRYPDADSPAELWENVLAGRRAFRRIPDERMRLSDYWSADRQAPDRFYAQMAAVLEGFEFDRVRYKIPGGTFRSTDMTHWLALDTAARALTDAGFPEGDGLLRQSTAVIVGNTLTGEFSRANLMRLRWPYVRRVVAAELREHGYDGAGLADFLDQLEDRYKSPFPPVGEDTLAGGLANTIAGRICNYFDFKGGGYTVDGACSSSLLAVATACQALRDGAIDAAIAGGVDLSIDPFETIGFAKTGALATDDMRVYDRNSNGFWPGEGCGMVVLLRAEDARARDLRTYALITGWGYSSDGKGGITRPEEEGHRLAIERAYQRTGFDIGSVAYLEGHGTGTAVGDATELRAFSSARRAVAPTSPPAAISTVKGNIGHTKAAAGIAGLLKATLAVQQQVIPPATGHLDPHPELGGDNPALRVPAAAELWPTDQAVRAGVSSMGFGGINAHIVVEHAGGERRQQLDTRTQALVRSRQDCELLLLDAVDRAELRDRTAHLAAMAPRLAFAELADLAGTLQRGLAARPVRAAVVAATPVQAERGFARLAGLLETGARSALDDETGVYLGAAGPVPRIGYLFPGQGSGRRGDGGALRRRFRSVDELYAMSGLPVGGDQIATEVAQPRIATSSVAGLRVLSLLGIEATVVTGHSLGELTSLHWAGAMDEHALLQLAAMRGRVMAEASQGGGTMASIAADADAVETLLVGERAVIAGLNSPRQTVISGPLAAVEAVCRRAEAKGLPVTRMAVSHAFHSPLVSPAAEAFGTHLGGVSFGQLARTVVSSVTGDVLAADADLRSLLVRQVTDAVRFAEAVSAMAADVDLLVEVGPGKILSRLARDIAPSVPAVAIDADAATLSGLFRTLGTAYALGAEVRHDELFAGRFTRPLALDKEFSFLASPCESAPAVEIGAARSGGAPAGLDAVLPDAGALDAAVREVGAPGSAPSGLSRPVPPGDEAGQDSLGVLRVLTAERAELPLEAVRGDTQPLDELHLSSITVGQIMNQAAQRLGMAPPVATSAFATSSLVELAQVLDDLGGTQLPADAAAAEEVAGVAPWVRAFTIEMNESVRSASAPAAAEGSWTVFAPDRHPLAAPLHDALARAGLGGGVLLCLPRDCDERHIQMMLDAARAAMAVGVPCRFVAVQNQRGAAALAKTLHLEVPSIATSVISLPVPDETDPVAVEKAVREIVADVASTTGFSEITYDSAGSRLTPVLRPLAAADGPPSRMPIGVGDVLLVTGGGKGITAECALMLARETGTSVGIVGRSDPQSDPELSANLSRFEATGVTYRYVRADVTSSGEMKAAVNEIRGALGPVNAVLHGAGLNEPTALARLDEATFRRALAPKTGGLEAVLTAAHPESLKLLVTFGSIIGRAGLRGEAHYAVANEWLSDLTRRVQDDYPSCRCVAVEWSVWSGAGMGERLGVLESLIREGISPIPAEAGVAMLRDILARPQSPTVLVVMGRAEALPTISLERRELPLLRFVDRALVHYPDIELVAEAELSGASDPYLADHELDGDMLFPAVLGMEAMAQAASALAGRRDSPLMDGLELLRPIVVPSSGSTTIRVAALQQEPGVIDVVIRSGETGFQADHFRATLRYPRPGIPGTMVQDAADALPPVPLEPMRDLYGEVLFQGRRFQRLREYRHLAARHCIAQISAEPGDPWFGVFLPGDLALADPGVRDAAMHGIQCCVPDATLLPVGVDRLFLADRDRPDGLVTMSARERAQDGDTYTYDVELRDGGGQLIEAWQGLRLQAVRKKDGAGPWVPALLGPYLERQLPRLLTLPVRCAVEPGAGAGEHERRARTTAAVSRMLGRPVTVRHRPDGKPETAEDLSVSSAHGAGLTFAVSGEGTVGCDVEPVRERTAAEWGALLGPAQLALSELVSRERGEELSAAATRVWGAVESLRKIGRASPGPITLAERGMDSWVVLHSGDARIATFSTRVAGTAGPVVFSVLAEARSSR